MKTLLQPCELIATPKSMEDLQEYLARFSGSEAIVAQTCAFMAWNLACELTKDNNPSN
tara:strand:- start:46 stop:219 length:174 start_codon:yes stop_codon:yes gene_type:complete